MSMLDRNALPAIPAPAHRWPRLARYTSPDTMDIDRAQLLICEDTCYEALSSTSWSCHPDLYMLLVGNDGTVQRHVSSGHRIFEGIESEASQWAILFVTQRRFYGPFTKSCMLLSPERWLGVLESLALPPSALELLHENNGGYAAHFSCCDPKESSALPCKPPLPNEMPCAYHILLKPLVGFNDEVFLYCRHDFHTGQKAMLIVGTQGQTLCGKLETLLVSDSGITIFHALHTALSVCFYQVENLRWSADEQVQRIELSTGYTNLQGPEKPLSIQELEISKSLFSTQTSLGEISNCANNLRRIFIFTKAELQRYVRHNNAISTDAYKYPHGVISVLDDAMSTRVSQLDAQISQISVLSIRIQTQIDSITTLIAQRDSRVNIAIAKSTRSDSETMRAIAFVTVIFLPATFLATFFSQVFFNVSSSSSASKLTVSKWIWLYFVCAVPLTVVVAWKFGFKSWFQGIFGENNIGRQLTPAELKLADASESV